MKAPFAVEFLNMATILRMDCDIKVLLLLPW
jgi:hypothetical protein